MEEFQEADVLWPWPDTSPPSPEEEEEEGSNDYGYDMPAAAPELDEYDAAIAFSCEPFSEPAASWSASSTSLSAALLSSDSSDDGGGFFLSGPSTVSAAGFELDATEEFLEADVLWPDDTAAADDDTAEFLWWGRRSRRVEEAAVGSAAAAVFCGKREGCRGPLVASSPIDIPMGHGHQRCCRTRTARRRRP